MRVSLLAAVSMAAVLSAAANAAAPRTVCTITVNSADEREIFKRQLPPGDYKFVELVERGRKDWLASACQQKVQCDALIISGHFDGGDEFYTDSNEKSEYLSVAEMETASCSDSCPGVFANLKEVYLFGCNTLKPLPDQHALSNRDRLRQIFKNVPVIYGFSSKAPLGRSAGPLLERWFQSGPAPDIGSGKVNAKLLGLFAPASMTSTTGVADSSAQAALRTDACKFLDERLSPAQKVAFLHEFLTRDVADVRLLLEQAERFIASISPAQRFEGKTFAEFNAIANDKAARERFIAAARGVEETSVHTRMMAVARTIGWLTPAQEEAEFARMLAERMAQDRIGRDEVELACARGRERENGGALQALASGTYKTSKVANAAALACLGNPEAHGRVLRAVTSANPDDIALAQAYLRHRPLKDMGDVRTIASAIGRMPASTAQVRALDTLAQQRLSDPDSLREIARLFTTARSLELQRAVAGILIRSDHRVLGHAELARSLKQYRIKSPDGGDVIDALIRVLETS